MLHDRTGRLEIGYTNIAQKYRLHDRTGRLENLGYWCNYL
ncbi:Heat shock protein GrpE [Moraxella catarrhalis]|nr:Heat shock protein GrpE [Moraxella catarrhalis]